MCLRYLAFEVVEDEICNPSPSPKAEKEVVLLSILYGFRQHFVNNQFNVLILV